jgi:hypothetical protein
VLAEYLAVLKGAPALEEHLAVLERGPVLA